MSIKIMSAIWEDGPMKQADRFVLLALADYANDRGECWPAVASVAEKTCMSVRGVQQTLRRLEADGWLKTEVNAGRNGCNKYLIAPAPCAPPQEMHPRTVCTTPPHMDAETPAPCAPEPSRTIIEPSEKPPLVPHDNKSRMVELPPDWVPSDRNRDDARQRQFSEEEIEHEAVQFRDYHHAKGTRFRDWDAGWRTWLGNARKFRGRGVAGTSKTGGGRSGGSMASIAARRRSAFQV